MSTFSRLKVSTVLILVTILTHLEKIGYELLQHFWLGCSFFGGKYLQKLVVFMNLTNAVFEGDGRMEQGFHETVWQSTVVITPVLVSLLLIAPTSPSGTSPSLTAGLT